MCSTQVPPQWVLTNWGLLCQVKSPVVDVIPDHIFDTSLIGVLLYHSRLQKSLSPALSEHSGLAALSWHLSIGASMSGTSLIVWFVISVWLLPHFHPLRPFLHNARDVGIYPSAHVHGSTCTVPCIYEDEVISWSDCEFPVCLQHAVNCHYCIGDPGASGWE